MKWKSFKPIQRNQSRIITKFLLFPMSLNGETKWLEKASILQVSYLYYSNLYWKSIQWVRNPTSKTKPLYVTNSCLANRCWACGTSACDCVCHIPNEIKHMRNVPIVKNNPY